MSITRLLQQASGDSADAEDPYFADVSLLLDGDGTNGANNNTFTDSSSVGATVTPDAVEQGSFSPYATSSPLNMTTDGGSGYFAAGRAYVRLPDNDAYCPEAGDFTIEAWVHPLKQNAYQAIWSKWSSGRQEIFFYINTSNKLSFTLGTTASGTLVSSTAPIAINSWTHVAAVRNGNALYLYVNGIQSGAVAYSGTVPNRADDVYIGDYKLAGYYPLEGYLSDVRWTKGTAVYTGNFTPPTTPLTATSNTKALLNFQDAGIYDLAGKSDIGIVGNAQIDTAVKKYGTGSIKFDGTGDYLPTPSSEEFVFGTGDFTIEGWAYNAPNNHAGLFQISSTAGGLSPSLSNTLAVGMRTNSSVWQVYANGSATDATQTWSSNTWYHFAMVRNSGALKLYVNGTAVITIASDTTNYTCSNLVVGGYYSTTYLLNGYIDDFRITKGVARYTSNFTPPTAALPKF